jgi:3-hydroxyacyl-[acyl-carrier-protein] dehydratase
VLHGPIIDFADFDLENIIADRDEIQKYNLQRFEMSQLDAIVHQDPETGICVGYKDVTPNEFWVRGHMPEKPLMPGVVMCEVAAQLSGYFAARFNLLNTKIIGLGGLKDIRFRNIVQPGDRLVVMLIREKCRPNVLVNCRFQGFVDQKLVVDGGIMGVPIQEDA